MVNMQTTHKRSEDPSLFEVQGKKHKYIQREIVCPDTEVIVN